MSPSPPPDLVTVHHQHLDSFTPLSARLLPLIGKLLQPAGTLHYQGGEISNKLSPSDTDKYFLVKIFRYQKYFKIQAGKVKLVN